MSLPPKLESKTVLGTELKIVNNIIVATAKHNSLHT